MKQKNLSLPLGENVNVEYTTDDDIVIHEVYWNGTPIFDLLISLDHFKGDDIGRWIFNQLEQYD